MKRHRIYSDRLYITGIRTARRGPYLPAIVTGKRYRSDSDLIRPWPNRVPEAISTATFRMDDGHLPEFQPRGDINAVTEFLAANPYAAAYWTEPEA